MNSALLQGTKKSFDAAMLLTTEMTLGSRLAKAENGNKLFIRVSTQFLGGRFDAKV